MENNLPQISDEAFLDMAADLMAKHHCSESEVQVDRESPEINRGDFDDGVTQGAWVKVWVWVETKTSAPAADGAPAVFM